MKCVILYNNYLVHSLLTKLLQRIHPSPMPCVKTCTVSFIGEGSLIQKSNPSCRTTPCWLSATAYAIDSYYP